MKDPFAAPVVYVGSTLSAEEVRRALPGAIVRKPAERLDLYRDRAFGASTFVLIDGVFFQRLAVAPRELLDLLGDGARVIGAASMGALRAAECWPAGMVGQGLIYRLFRRGWLDSDDEVAVSFQADRPALGSVALVNVRYAARRGAESGLLSREEAEALVCAARAIYFTDRQWPRILDDAGLPRTLCKELAVYDLKREDALRCLRYVARLPPLASAPRVMIPRDLTREREAAPSELAPQSALASLVSWSLVSGRYQRVLTVTGARAKRLLESRVSARFSRELLRALEERGELDRELFHHQAFVEGVRRAGRRRASAELTAQVREELSKQHGAELGWQSFLATLGPRGRRRLVAFSVRLAAARAAASAHGLESAQQRAERSPSG